MGLTVSIKAQHHFIVSGIPSDALILFAISPPWSFEPFDAASFAVEAYSKIPDSSAGNELMSAQQPTEITPEPFKLVSFYRQHNWEMS